MAVMAPTMIANGGSASNGMTVSVWKKSSRSNERVMKINASPFFFLLFFVFVAKSFDFDFGHWQFGKKQKKMDRNHTTPSFVIFVVVFTKNS